MIVINPSATNNPDGDNVLEVLFFNQIPDALNNQIIAFQWNLGTSTEANGALISTEKQFKHTFATFGIYYIWLRVKKDVYWSNWEKMEVSLKDKLNSQTLAAPLNLRDIQ